MFLIVGLGNPGQKYAETRHNAGFWFIDEVLKKAGGNLTLASKLQAETAKVRWHGAECIIARPTTFMNHSGKPVRAVLDYYKVEVENLLVAYDELDLPPGAARLKMGGGHGGHNGLRDICQHLSDRNFMRLRIGIGHPGHKAAVTRYVLGRSPDQVRAVVDNSIDRAIDAMPLVLEGRWMDAQTKLHSSNE